jgi:hypothetical protein
LYSEGNAENGALLFFVFLFVFALLLLLGGPLGKPVCVCLGWSGVLVKLKANLLLLVVTLLTLLGGL